MSKLKFEKSGRNCKKITFDEIPTTGLFSCEDST